MFAFMILLSFDNKGLILLANQILFKMGQLRIFSHYLVILCIDMRLRHTPLNDINMDAI
jgi:hypothetical protein